MALNNFMHPRNIYKTPPDFRTLAKIYPEFLSVSKIDTSGKVSIDFKDPKSLRVLTKCLLKSDFDVDIDIPVDRLVPTLPLRLNYILWIEDLLAAVKISTNIWGIDIGTGACAIYPVLGCKKNNWKMIGTESDEKSLQKAQENIEKNNLQNLIKLNKSSSSSLITSLLDSEPNQNFDFCMCNPPFYSSIQELYESRDVTRQPPKNGFTGSPQELITEGGELNFCKKLITESQVYRDRIRIFTTMVGHKYNLKELMQELSAHGIKCTHTEFCQGRVTRWGVAWTFQDYNIYKLVPPREKLRKKNNPISYLLPQLGGFNYNVETCTEKIISILHQINIQQKILNRRGNDISVQLTAFENTWSHQRRKRRLLQMTKANEAKKIKNSNSITNLTSEEFKSEEVKCSDICTNNNNSDNEGIKYELNIKANEHPVINDPIVEAFLKVLKKDKDILLQIEYLSGSVGKEGVYQILQYIKNNWK